MIWSWELGQKLGASKRLLTSPDHFDPPLPATRAMKARPIPAIMRTTLTMLLAFCHFLEPA
jgi:hypothetical protein